MDDILNQNNGITTLADRAKKYYLEIESSLEKYRDEKEDVIVGLDPEGRKYWVGKTESSILEQRNKEGNTNLIYFIKLSPYKVKNEKLLISVC
ncbi:MAG: hypothetical protein PHZ04_04405 [Patescibacteria group bacterium]|nr:hypothetical protein [Patescibacteria group bacterium]MDD5554848.1 hypothetical protein [Patescibacteria group bacterium]